MSVPSKTASPVVLDKRAEALMAEGRRARPDATLVQNVIVPRIEAQFGDKPRQAAQHDATNARTAYQDFFALWKDADPNIPILKEAKAEYAKLQ